MAVEPQDLDRSNINNWEYNEELGLYFYQGGGLGYTSDELEAEIGHAEV